MEGYRMIENIRKRDGRLVAFELDTKHLKQVVVNMN